MNLPKKFIIGCSSFSNNHWKKIFYPDKLPQSKWFNFYCEHFNTLEFNSSFYRFPSSESLQTWYARSPDNFIFSVKTPRIITHLKKFNDCQQLIDDFYLACEQGLKDKLGCVLFQFPPSVHYSEEKLQQITAGLNPNFKNVIEFRHQSWWVKKTYDELTKNQLIFCSVSYPNLPDTIIANTETVYLRLHGNSKLFYSNYSNEELNQWYQSALNQTKIKEVYIYFNNTASTAGVLNAQKLKEIINSQLTDGNRNVNNKE